MSMMRNGLTGLSDLLHDHLLKWIVVSYSLAALVPALGLWIKEAEVVNIGSPVGRVVLTLPKLLLAVLLFNAGVRVKLTRIGALTRRPGVVVTGLAANLGVPLLFLLAMVPALRFWHSPAEAATVLVGLALVSAMPIAGSSTGWAQAARGDMATSLGLVLGSTLTSPLTTPAVLHVLASVVPGRYGAQLHDLAGQGTGFFLMTWVLFPSLLGIGTRWILGDDRVNPVETWLKVASPLALMVLCYANASACLPSALGHPDWDYLAIVLTFVVGLCSVTFAAGFALSGLLRVERDERVALVFGLGMNNNGTGLVLASLAIGSAPEVMLPIILYNLAQHLVAGCVQASFRRRESGDVKSWTRCHQTQEIHKPNSPMRLHQRANHPAVTGSQAIVPPHGTR